MSDTYYVIDFSALPGEGVIANICTKADQKVYTILIGNLKLMKQYRVLDPYEELLKDIQKLEVDGDTVVTMAIDHVPQMIITLEEKEKFKSEAKYIV